MTDTERLERFFYDLYPRYVESAPALRHATHEDQRRAFAMDNADRVRSDVARFALLELLKEREGREDVDALLRQAVERTGYGVQVTVYGHGGVFVRWRKGGLTGTEQRSEGRTLREALEPALCYDFSSSEADTNA